jgi:excinuclease ABC subunit C
LGKGLHNNPDNPEDKRGPKPLSPEDKKVHTNNNGAKEPDKEANIGPLELLSRLRQKARELPASSGVYLMKDKDGKILYVGKAKLLPNRVSSYFHKSLPSARISLMVSKVTDFEVVVTTTEKEALLLENSLIKKLRPRFNVILRDDKTYPSLRLSVTEPFPRLEIVRRPLKDGSIIYGPFPSATALKESLKLVNKLFPLRRCRTPDVKKITRPCLNYQMGLCVAPCRPDYTQEEYKVVTDNVRRFFKGEFADLLKSLEDTMQTHVDRYEFEAAALIRDRLYDLRATLERQVVENFGDKNIDVWDLAIKDGFTGAALVSVRQGAVTGCQPIVADGASLEDNPDSSTILLALMGQYYSEKNPPPQEILLPKLPQSNDLLLFTEFLSSLSGKKVALIAPKRGDKLKLLAMAAENARLSLEERLASLTKTSGAMAEIQSRLRLPKLPRRLECFDLAHLQGEAATCGMVVMEEGDLKKSAYRRFKIKEAKGGDDYAGMREVIKRRFAHSDKEKWPWPDLLLLDGGKGQIQAALKAFSDLNLTPPSIAGITKDREHGGPDRIFLPGRKNPADLNPGSLGLLILQKLRDEAHRFSRSYHHNLRKKKALSSLFADIKGLGPARLKALDKGFESLEALFAATDEEIRKVAPVNQEILTQIRSRLEGHLKTP